MRLASRSTWGARSVRWMAVTYLTAMLLIPLLVILQDGLKDGLGPLVHTITRPVAWHALGLTLWTAALMAVVNAVMGTLTAWALVRYEFPGKSILNAIVDVPFAIPTLVAGVMLVVLFGPQQPLGAWLEGVLGTRVIFAPPGIILALLFVTFPFVVRSVQPVLLEMDRFPEEAAATLGAGTWTTFRRVVLPVLQLPLLSGTLLSFARAIGEFGSIVVVAGNIPLRSQTAAVYVFGEVESYNQHAASAMSVVMLGIALSLVLAVDLLQGRFRREAR